MITLNPIRWLFASPFIFVLLFGIYCVTQTIEFGLMTLLFGLVCILIGAAVTKHYLTDK